MKKFLFLLLCIVTFVGCGGSDNPQKAVMESLEKAMGALSAHQYEEYFNCVDFGSEIDSMQRDVLIKTYAQYQDQQEQRKGSFCKLTVVDIAFSSDTICDVCYEMLFPDSTTEMCSQKMIKIGDAWKIRARN